MQAAGPLGVGVPPDELPPEELPPEELPPEELPLPQVSVRMVTVDNALCVLPQLGIAVSAVVQAVFLAPVQ